MPLNRKRNHLSDLDERIYIYSVEIERTGTGGPKKTETQHGPYWAGIDYLTRKQGEIEVSSRITSMQQVRFKIRYDETVKGYLSKAGKIQIVGDAQSNFEIISIADDIGRKQYIYVVTELKQ